MSFEASEEKFTRTFMPLYASILIFFHRKVSTSSLRLCSFTFFAFHCKRTQTAHYDSFSFFVLSCFFVQKNSCTFFQLQKYTRMYANPTSYIKLSLRKTLKTNRFVIADQSATAPVDVFSRVRILESRDRRTRRRIYIRGKPGLYKSRAYAL